MLGHDAASWISSGDATADRATVAQFVRELPDAKNSIEKNGEAATLTIGADGYPFAFPIVKTGERWRFDTAAGKEELFARRIGENELECDPDAFAPSSTHSSSTRPRTVTATARSSMRSSSRATQARRDGLYWPAKAGEPPSPLGALVASAADEGYAKQKKPQPFHGYYFRPLNGQGPDALTGRLDYVVRGRAIGGFAVVAWPARYGNSGVMTFIVNHEGVVYEKDLGPDSHAVASGMTALQSRQGLDAGSRAMIGRGPTCGGFSPSARASARTCLSRS